MVIEVLIVIGGWIALGYLVSYITGLAWWIVTLIVLALLLIYDSSVIQAERNDLSRK